MAPVCDQPKRASKVTSPKPQDEMFSATPGFSPGLSKRSSLPVNKGTMPGGTITGSPLAASALAFADKENLNKYDRIKQTRRAATKMYSKASPVKAQFDCTSRASSKDMATLVESPTLSPMRERPNGSMDPPPLKRARVESEGNETIRTSSQPSQLGNIAGLLHTETLGIITSPVRSHASVAKTASPTAVGVARSPSVQPRTSLPPLASIMSLDGASHETPSAPSQPTHSPTTSLTNSIGKDSSSKSAHTMAYTTELNPLRVPSPLPPSYPDPSVHPRKARTHVHGGEAIGLKEQISEPRIDNHPPSYLDSHIQPAPLAGQLIFNRTEPNGVSQYISERISGPPTYPQQAPRLPNPLTSSNWSTLYSASKCEGAGLPTPPSDDASEIFSSNETIREQRHVASDPATHSVSITETAPLSILRHQTSPFQTFEISRQGLRPYDNKQKKLQIYSDGPAQLERTLSARNYHNFSAEQDPNTTRTIHENFIQAQPDDAAFIAQVRATLDKRRKLKRQNFGRRQAARIHDVLSVASPPNRSEALFLSADEAAEYLKPNRFFSGIIVTQNQQPRPLQTTTEFLNEYYDDSATAYIQDADVEASDTKAPAPRKVTIGKLKGRFFQDPKTSKKRPPWNCLELATHVEDGLRPAFLAGEDCRLLTKVKLPSSDDKAGRRGYEPGWKEVEKWALLAQAGALTEPHQDSHGYNTYITVNQGVIGFGFLANPTAEERAQWQADPFAYTGGRWRYVVLRPGQTVYFPSGTVHFVFRLPTLGDTLAFGGHVLRCSQIVRWIRTLIEEQADPEVTNEDLTVSAPAYLDRVEKFVRQALKDDRTELWGGKENIEEFLALKAEYFNEEGGNES